MNLLSLNLINNFFHQDFSPDNLNPEVQLRFLPLKPSHTLPTARCSETDFKKEIQADRPRNAKTLSLSQHYEKFQAIMTTYNNARPRPPIPMTTEDFPMWAYTNGFNSPLNPVIQNFYSRNGVLSRYPCYIAEMMNKLEQLNTECIRGERSDKDYSDIAINQIVHSDQFKSCSLSKAQAGNFCSKDGGTFFFIKKGDKALMAVRAMEKSAYPQQKEWIVAPGQSFNVTEVVPNFNPDQAFGSKCRAPGKTYKKVVLESIQ